jgi:hypothetical protein
MATGLQKQLNRDNTPRAVGSPLVTNDRVRIDRLLRLSAIMVVGLGVVLQCTCAGPSDKLMEQNFLSHREDFDRLLRMFDEDQYLVRVAPRFVRPLNGMWPNAKGQMPISPERWKEYKYLFSICSLDDGVERGPRPNDVFFLAWSRGLLDRASEKGFLYCRAVASDEHDGSSTACIQYIEGITPERRLRFREIAADWYIFQDDPR